MIAIDIPEGQLVDAFFSIRIRSDRVDGKENYP
jgi:hypothetical protein